ncbi:MAG TPA: hypothetical protein VJC17_00030 [Candidatus Dojkabacteria bacterium]|nr:hypothetical protein [Candidatus Dojkabacteria bacterium]
MNRSWITLVVVAVVTLIIIAGYEFVNSLTGANLDFSKQVSPIENDLGTQELIFLKGIKDNIQTPDENLDGANQ